MTTTYLISGASRSLGLETARQLLNSDPSVRVFAGARNPSTAYLLQALIAEYPDRLVAIQLDVTDASSVKAAVATIAESPLGKDGIDVLWNNAGVIENMASPLESTPEELEKTLQTNVYGVMRLTSAAIPLLRAGKEKKIIVTSSLLGSIGGPTSRAAVATTYSITKAAVNMYSVKLARELAPEGFTVLIFHPGYVQTDINNGAGDITVVDSVHKSIAVLLPKTKAESGKFFNYTGEELPW